MSFAARWTAGEPVLNDELVRLHVAQTPMHSAILELTAGLPEVIRSAWRLLQARRRVHLR